MFGSLVQAYRRLTNASASARQPEARYVVQVNPDDEIVCVAPGLADQRIAMSDLAAVHVQTYDIGPFGADVWWLFEDRAGEFKVAFPQMATGEDSVLERLRQLDGFEVKGMNSVENARFLCWQSS